MQAIPEIHADADALADAAVAKILGWLGDNHGRFSICLSGGSTPKRLYERMAKLPLPFDRIHWFFGDERCVPPGDAKRNETMVRAALLDHVPAPEANIHAIPVTASPAESAVAYEATLKAYYGQDVLDAGRPLFDLMLLGLGSDGHTASLFPGKPALAVTGHWAVSSEAGLDPFVPRVTLTFPAIASSRHTVFLVSGADKQVMLKRALAGDDLPAARVTSIGSIEWLVDKAAIGQTA